MTYLLLVAAASLVTGVTVHGHSIHHKLKNTGCCIAINGGLPKPQPLLLKLGGSVDDGHGFHLPEDSCGTVQVAVNDVIHIACSGDRNHFTPLGTNVQEALAICESDDKFTIGNDSYTFKELSCKKHPFHTARATGASCSSDRAILIEIGFKVGVDFFKTLEICFDDTVKNTLWSKFELVSGIGGYQSGFPGADFIADSFYPGLSPSSLYSRNGQRTTFSKILNSTELARRYVSHVDDFFIARGHLTAKADFVYGSQHRATFHYVNVAPQWQTFNGGNWNLLEQDLRRFASHRHMDLVVYTGTHGIATLPDVAGVEKELWLYQDENNNKAIPVPRLFWKVAYDPMSGRAIAFVGVNNPYVEKIDESYVVCVDICNQVNWVKWNRSDVKKGYVYCCAVDAHFRAVFNTLSDFKVTGVLSRPSNRRR